MKNGKKTLAILLALVMSTQVTQLITATTLNQNNTLYNNSINTNQKQATTLSKQYLENSPTTFNNNLESVQDFSSDVNLFTGDVHEFVWETSVKTTDTGLQSIISLNDSTHSNHYITLYMKGNKLGFEVRSNDHNRKFSKEITANNIANGQWHKVKLVATPNKYTLYMDDQELGFWTADVLFLNGINWTPTKFTVGGMKRHNETQDNKNWFFNGQIKDVNISVKKVVAVAPEDAQVVYQNSNLSLKENTTGINITENSLDELKNLQTGAITVRYKASSANQKISALFSLSNKQMDNSYAVVYVDPSSNKVGVEVRDGDSSATTNYNQTSTNNVSIKDDYWHTVTTVFGENKFDIYVDGKKVISNDKNGFFSKITNPDTVKIGALDRRNRENQWAFNGLIDELKVWNGAVLESTFIDEHNATKYEPEYGKPIEGAIKSEPQKLFYQGYDNSVSYRIPSILTTKNGTIIAAIDKRQSGAADQGNIDTVIRRSTDGGQTWLEPQTIIDLPQGNERFAFTIDASMVEDKQTGEVFLLVDMFPESTALMPGDTINDVTSGYKVIDDNKYYILKAPGNKEYTIRENGIVYNEENQPTDYTVPNFTNGQLFKGEEEVGNIFLKNSELHLPKTSYMWMVSSKDNGETWSEPVDITKDVKKDWQLFFGTGPGVGIQTESGRLVVPVYYTNSNIGGSQSSAVIYSDDHGKTWHLGESPNDGRVEGNSQNMNNSQEMLTESQVVEVTDRNGDKLLKLFCRSPQGRNGVKIATSRDGGETWDDQLQTDSALVDPYCQMTIVPYPYEVAGYEGKQMFLFANPDASSRVNGTVRLGYYEPETDTFEWINKQVVEPGAYSYSCLTVIGENNIGLFYEADVPNMMFTNFNIEWLTSDLSALPMESATVEEITLQDNIVTLKLDQSIMVLGNVSMKALINNQEVLIPYTSGSATNTLTFTMPASLAKTNDFIPLEIVVGENGYFGNRENKAIKVPNTDLLKEQINLAKEKINSDKYQQAGVDNLKAIISEVEPILNRQLLTQSEVQEAHNKVINAINELVEKINKADLQAKIDSVKNLNKTDYTAESFDVFKQALDNANAVLADINATQSQVDEALANLTKAVEDLKPVNNDTQIDTVPPTSPTELKVYEITTNGAKISWTQSKDNIGVAGYNIYLNGTLLGTIDPNNSNTIEAILSKLTANTEYTVEVTAFDKALNESVRTSMTFKTLAEESNKPTDTTTPQQPTVSPNTNKPGKSNVPSTYDNLFNTLILALGGMLGAIGLSHKKRKNKLDK